LSWNTLIHVPKYSLNSTLITDQFVEYRPFKAGFPDLKRYFTTAWQRREFVSELSRVDRENEHLDTFFGKLWSIIAPLLSAAVYYLFIFVVQGAQGPTRFLHLMLGVFIFEFVSTAASRGSTSIVGAAALINNTKFPRVLLPMTQVLTAWRIFLPSLGVYVVFHVALEQPVTIQALQALPALILILIFSSGLAMFASAAQVYFRDTASLMPFILRLVMFASPVLYFPEQAKAMLGGSLLAVLNPIFCMVEIFSGSIVRGDTFDAWTWIIAFVWAFSTFIFGLVFLITREGEFAARI
jgi:teichoic acid transport system permease protein